MEKSVLRTIQAHQMIQAGEGVVVGLSGGADSSALLVVLKKLSATLDIKLHAVHVNHGLRGEEALRDQAFAEALCKRLGVSFEVVSVNVAQLAKDQGLSFETAGRLVRYDTFEQVRQRLMFHKIAVAHHRGDQSETLMFRLIRGTGLSGLRGMRYVRDRYVIRPLLDQTRQQIEAYCRQEALDIMVDSTNLEADYGRNFIRLKLFPQIDAFFGGDIADRLSQTAELLAQDADYLDSLAMAQYQSLVKMTTAGAEVSAKALGEQPFSIASRVIRLLYQSLSGTCYDLANSHVQQILALTQVGGHRQFSLKGLAFESSQGLISVKVIEPLVMDQEAVPPSFETEWVINPNNLGIKPNENTVYLDADCIQGALYLRHRRPGDKFVPSGMTGRKKLQDFFTDAKIPAHLRDQVWLLCDEVSILWVCGYRQSEAARVTQNTSRILRVTLTEVVTHL